MNDQQLRDLLRDLRDQPVPAASRARVREAVTAGITRRPRAWWKPALLAAAAGVVAVIAVVGWETSDAPVPVAVAPPVAVTSTPPPAPEPAPVVAPVPVPAPAPPKPAARPARPPAADPEPEFITTANPSMTIRIETPDPEVVILLVN